MAAPLAAAAASAPCAAAPAAGLRRPAVAARVAACRIVPATPTLTRLRQRSTGLGCNLNTRRAAARAAATSSGDNSTEADQESKLALGAPIVSALLPFILSSQDALAAEGQFGVLEGRSIALIHPIVMIGLLGTSLWSAYLGWQWRRVRTIPNEVAVLKKQMPAPVEGAPPSDIEQKINKLTEHQRDAGAAVGTSLLLITESFKHGKQERKTLVKGNFRDRHWNVGSILLGGGVTMSIGGAVNTYLRTGKLFPGPHLFAGAGITALWAAAASLVPAMQKGDDNARNAHIALNVVNIGLFLWQVPTGFEIVEKVFQFAPWP